jgi:hypothetical protein
MKPNAKFLLMFTLSVLLFAYSCKKETPKDPVDDHVEEVDDHVEEADDDKRPLKPLRILLTYKELAQMLEHYDETKKPALMQQMGGNQEDARIQFISLKELKQYIKYIEKQARRKDIKLTGINFISAAYPKGYDRDPEKSDYQTLIMMPAMTIGKEKMVSIDLNKSEIGKPLTLRDLLKSYNGYNWYYDGGQAGGLGTANGINFEGKNILELTTPFQGDGISSAGNRMEPSPPK